jgi:hypothetical protein
MPDLDALDVLFAASALLFQIVLVVHFALRKWNFFLILRYGWIVYALSVPAAVVSLLLLLGGTTSSLWLGGFIYLVWAAYGYGVEYVRRIRWRNPIRWSILAPYVLLYLATVMFYWWPVGLVSRPLWYVCAVLFLVSTTLNITSHKGPEDGAQPA